MTASVRSMVLWSPRFPRSPHPFMAHYVRGLTDAGVDVTVVSNHDDERPADPDRSGAEVIETLWEAPVSYKLGRLARLAPRALRTNAPDVGRLVRRLVVRYRHPHTVLSRLYIDLPMLAPGADLIHIGWFDGAVFMNELIETTSAPTVVTCHGSDLLVDVADEGYRRRAVEVMDRVDVVHCVSEDLGRAAVALGADPERIVTGHWGVDTAFLTPAERSVEGPLHVVTVARVDPVKGLTHGLEAIAAVRDRGVDVRYTIVGGPVHDVPVDDVNETIERHDLGDVVDITGWVPSEVVRDHLHRAHVFLLPSLSEGLANAMLEAMAAGLPVVVSDVGGLSEAVTDGVEGHLVAPGDPDGLADALVALEADRRAAAEMGRRGRERVVAHHDTSVRTRRLLDDFTGALARGRVGSPR